MRAEELVEAMVEELVLFSLVFLVALMFFVYMYLCSFVGGFVCLWLSYQ